MEIKITRIETDGYVHAKIIDGENYLSYFYSPTNGWKTSHGIVDGKQFKQNTTLYYSWLQKGRGKVSDKTWNKLGDMHQFFHKNKPDNVKCQ